jgi:hypothetical protein
MWSHPREDFDFDCMDYTAAVTVQLAAPQLTHLLLYGIFGDVLGLQQPSKLAHLSLTAFSSDAIKATRLAELVSGSPSVADFYFDGWEHNCDAPEMSLEIPILRAPVAEQQQNWVEHLQGLRGLKDLELSVSLRNSGVLALTALTSLTYLDYDRWGGVEDGKPVGELKQHLTKLTHDLEGARCIVRDAWGFRQH